MSAQQQNGGQPMLDDGEYAPALDENFDTGIGENAYQLGFNPFFLANLINS
jgi:hypothetical protein